MFYRQNKTFWYQFCNLKHFLKTENIEDSLASPCEDGSNFCIGAISKKWLFFYILPNLIKMKKFSEQLNILKGDYDGHFFVQRYFGSQSVHRKKIL